MNEKFENKGSHIIIDDNGIACHNDMLNLHFFYPYGSMSELKLVLMGLSIKSDKFCFSYAPVADQKQKLKQLLPTLQNLNASAVKCEPVKIDMSAEAQGMKLEKNFESISAYLGGFDNKHTQMWNEGISNILTSMDSDEEFLYAFKGNILYINGGRESLVNYVGLISNKRFYFAGSEGKAILTYLKSGSVELKDVHAVTIGEASFAKAPYVKFEVKNDDYTLATFSDTAKIKERLEAGIKACESKSNTPTIVQSAVSAADELKKFKELFDMGVITQEEFDAKKKQLLGL